MFVVRNLRASRVNLLMNDFAAGLPSPLAFLGLGAAIAPDLGAGRWTVGVLPVLHEVHVSEGRTKPEMEPRKLKGEKTLQFRPIETVEDLVGTVRVSLLLDVPGFTDEHLLQRALRGRRIAGGVIETRENQQIDVVSVTPNGDAFRRLDRGYAMIRPDAPEFAHVATGAVEDLAALARLLYHERREPGAPWLVPVAVGHRLLEDPAMVPPRENTRDPSVPHVFTEPVVGVAELISVRDRRLTGLDEAGLRERFWRWTTEGDWITGHPFHHPARRASAAEEFAHGQ